MPILSTCLIIKNEAASLGRCLESIVNLADEIIIVDTGSTDNSITIARKFTDQVYYFDWERDFSAARNFALDKANGDWVLMIDGDEELITGAQEAVLELISSDKGEAFLLRIVNCNGNGAAGHMLNFELSVRLFRNHKFWRYSGIIQENIVDNILAASPAARIIAASEISIRHYNLGKNLEDQTRLKRNLELIKDSYPEGGEQSFRLGFEYFRRHHFSAAWEYFISAFAAQELQIEYLPRLLRYMTVCCYLLGNYQTALDLVDKNWLPLFPESGDAYFLKGLICRELGRYTLAYESFNSSLEAVPTAFPASDIYYVLKEHILYYLGGLAEYYMNKEKALFYYLESIKQNPCLYKSLQQMIHILNPREYPQYTVEALNQVFELSDIRLQIQLANTFYHEGAYFLALDCINRLAADKQLPENIRLLKGLCLLRSRRYKPAKQELQAINRDKDMFIKAQQYLMLYYWLQGDYPKVAGSLEKIKQAGTDPGFLAILSTFSHDSALKLEFIATVDKENHSILTEILDFLVELGSPVEIDKVWPRLFPLKHRPSQILAETLYKYKKYELAEEELRRLLAGGNLEAAAHYYLAKSCWAQGNLTDAAKFMDRAIQLGLDIPRVRWEISRIHQELAIAHLEHGLSGCPDSLELCEYLQELKEQLIEV